MVGSWAGPHVIQVSFFHFLKGIILIALAVDEALNHIEIRVRDTVLEELNLLVLREYGGLILLIHKHVTCAGMGASVQVTELGKVKVPLGSTSEDRIL